MTHKSTNHNLENIRNQIEELKSRLDKIEKNIDLQEEVINLLHKNLESVFYDAFQNNEAMSVNEIMKKAFPSGKIPKILDIRF